MTADTCHHTFVQAHTVQIKSEATVHVDSGDRMCGRGRAGVGAVIPAP